jgi:prepilin-type processing-associated H-X9-DG protein
VQTDAKGNLLTSAKFGTINTSAVSDGLSNTVAVMEKSVKAGHYQPSPDGNWDWWELPGWAHDADWPNMRLAGNWLPLLRDTDPRPSWMMQWDGRPAEFSFGSNHTSGVNALFGDGSVKVINFSVNACGNSGWSDQSCVLYHLGGRQDGWVVDANAY